MKWIIHNITWKYETVIQHSSQYKIMKTSTFWSFKKVFYYSMLQWREINLFVESSMMLQRKTTNYSSRHDFNWPLNLNVVPNSFSGLRAESCFQILLADHFSSSDPESLVLVASSNTLITTAFLFIVVTCTFY